MVSAEQALLDALKQIRDSTYRDAATLRGIADRVISRYNSGDFNKTGDKR